MAAPRFWVPCSAIRFQLPFISSIPAGKSWGQGRAFSLVNAFAYLIICMTGLTGVLMALIPTETVMVLLIFCGLVSHCQYLPGAGPEVYQRGAFVADSDPVPVYPNADKLRGPSGRVYCGGYWSHKICRIFRSYYGNPIFRKRRFLSSLLIAALLAYVVDKNISLPRPWEAFWRFAPFVGMIHAETVALFPPEGVVLELFIWLLGRSGAEGLSFRDMLPKRKPSIELP